MRKKLIAGAIALGAIIAGVVHLTNDVTQQSPATLPSSPGEKTAAEPVTQAAQPSAVLQPGRTDSQPVPSDPRLAALAVSPDNGLIEFVVAADGKVIAEIDRDPSSPSFKKPLREYTYSGGKVIGLTVYRYLGEHVEIARTAVSYKPDGSVDEYAESTRVED